jgi:hypothetical protein
MGPDTVQVSFEIDVEEDRGPLGGWNVDQFCIVADPDAVCGDGVVSGFAGCDVGVDFVVDAFAGEQLGDRCRLAAGHEQHVTVGDDPGVSDLVNRRCLAVCRGGPFDSSRVFRDVPLHGDDARV